MRTLPITLALLASIYACSSDKKFEGQTESKSEPKAAPAPAPVPVADATPVNDTPIPEPEPEEVPAQVPDNVVVSDNNIEFGADEVFHIGDGALGANTACAREIQSFDLTGVTFFFEFEVENDDTEVELTVGKVCGADYDGNRFSLINAGTNASLKSLFVPTDKSGVTKDVWAPFPAVKLAKGVYSVVVASGQSSLDVGNNDFDDFLIGKINVKANKRVKALRIYTE